MDETNMGLSLLPQKTMRQPTDLGPTMRSRLKTLGTLKSYVLLQPAGTHQCFTPLLNVASEGWRICYLPSSLHMVRVWKGILRIQDLTKIRCGIRENAKYLDGFRDLTPTREGGFTKIWVRDAGFCCLSVGNSGNRHDPKNPYSGKSESTRQAPNINRKG